jgi:ATPase subunit of ABC transporter with duplicated ATPase domains
VLLVTHDRWLAQSIATQVWRVDGDEMRAYKGNYEEYLKLRSLEAEGGLPGSNGDDAARERAQMEAERERSKEERRQRKAAEKRAEQAAAMETRIHELEARLGQLSNQLEAASVAGDVAKVHRLGVEYQQTDAELHRVMSEWAELA